MAIDEQQVLILAPDGVRRKPYKETLIKANLRVDFVSTLACVQPAIMEMHPICFVHDWSTIEASQAEQFQLAMAKKPDTVQFYRYIIADNVDTKMLAYASDALINKVMTYNKAHTNLGQEIVMDIGNRGKRDINNALWAIRHECQNITPAALDMKIESLYNSFPQDKEVRLEYANLCIKNDKFEIAGDIAQKILRIEENNLRAINIMSRIAMKGKNFEDAIKILQEAREFSAYDNERALLLADAFYGNGNLDEAFACYEEAHHLTEGGSKEAITGMGKIYVEQDELESAIALFRSGLSEEESAAFFNNAAVLAVNEGKLESAIKLYESAIKTLRTNHLKPRIYFNLALAYRKGGDLSHAKKFLKKSLRLDNNYEKAKRQLDSITGKNAS